jgi:hypothetical protein
MPFCGIPQEADRVLHGDIIATNTSGVHTP